MVSPNLKTAWMYKRQIRMQDLFKSLNSKFNVGTVNKTVKFQLCFLLRAEYIHFFTLLKYKLGNF